MRENDSTERGSMFRLSNAPDSKASIELENLANQAIAFLTTQSQEMCAGLDDALKPLGDDASSLASSVLNEIYATYIEAPDDTPRVFRNLSKLVVDVKKANFEKLALAVGIDMRGMDVDEHFDAVDTVLGLLDNEGVKKVHLQEVSVALERAAYSGMSEASFSLLASCLREVAKNKLQAEKMTYRLDDTDYPVIMRLPVLWEGWESDSEVVIVNINGVSKALMNGHEIEAEFLHDKITEYQDVIRRTQEAIALIGKRVA